MLLDLLPILVEEPVVAPPVPGRPVWPAPPEAGVTRSASTLVAVATVLVSGVATDVPAVLSAAAVLRAGRGRQVPVSPEAWRRDDAEALLAMGFSLEELVALGFGDDL